MPINYLDLGPQISEYCRQAAESFIGRAERSIQALDLLGQFASEIAAGKHTDLSNLHSTAVSDRCARPDAEVVSDPFFTSSQDEYNLLASDGSQISSSHHDALPISLVNIATVFYQPESSTAPGISVQSELLKDDKGNLRLETVSENEINTTRDVRELEALANWEGEVSAQLILMGDGPLELFREPTGGPAHDRLFQRYLAALQTICQKGGIIAGYTDKPRARLVVRMLEIIYPDKTGDTLTAVTDANLFARMLPPGSRSAIFQLNFPAATSYGGPISLRFFYLNVGRIDNPWIVRVETTASAVETPGHVELLHKAILSQCAISGTRAYPYILHRAHEEAVVRYADRDEVTRWISTRLLQQGVAIPLDSHKSRLKGLETRTRME